MPKNKRAWLGVGTVVCLALVVSIAPSSAPSPTTARRRERSAIG